MMLIKIFCSEKDWSEPIYEFLIEKRENTGIKHLNDAKAFIECSNIQILWIMFMRILMSII